MTIATHSNPEFETILITSHKLNGKNYLQWYQFMLMFIFEKGKDTYLTCEIEIQRKEIQNLGSGRVTII